MVIKLKILVVSDNHREEKILTEIVQKMGDQVDLMIHCGDSELAPDQEPMSNFKAVKGNNDGYTLSGMDRDSMPDFFIQKRGHLLSPRYTINSPQKS